MAGGLYRITVEPYDRVCPIRKERFKFRLCNNGEPCGSRLNKTVPDSKTSPPFPFSDGSWMYHNTRKLADAAAAKLQEYLDKIEARKAKK